MTKRYEDQLTYNKKRNICEKANRAILQWSCFLLSIIAIGIAILSLIKPQLDTTPWPHNGYVYFLTNKALSWEAAREYCRRSNGDLAVIGIKHYKTRLSIATILNLKDTWVGLKENQNNDQWTWIDGSAGNQQEILWTSNREPPSKIHSDCGHLNDDQHSYNMDVDKCYKSMIGLCEKKFFPIQ